MFTNTRTGWGISDEFANAHTHTIAGSVTCDACGHFRLLLGWVPAQSTTNSQQSAASIRIKTQKQVIAFLHYRLFTERKQSDNSTNLIRTPPNLPRYRQVEAETLRCVGLGSFVFLGDERSGIERGLAWYQLEISQLVVLVFEPTTLSVLWRSVNWTERETGSSGQGIILEYIFIYNRHSSCSRVCEYVRLVRRLYYRRVLEER